MRDLSRRHISKSKVPVTRMIGPLSVNYSAVVLVRATAFRLAIISIVTVLEPEMVAVRKFN
jgi:hypothetical protein